MILYQFKKSGSKSTQQTGFLSLHDLTPVSVYRQKYEFRIYFSHVTGRAKNYVIRMENGAYGL